MSNQDYSFIKIGARPSMANAVTGQNARRAALRGVAIAAAIALSGCAPDITKHGHIFGDEDVAQVKTGMSRDQVVLALGTPDTKSTVGQEAYYYISSTTKRSAAFLTPTIVDRKVLAVYFDKKDSVQRVAHYGLEDGKVIDFVKRETPSKGSEDGLLKELFRNIGRPATPVNPNGY
jgi:outer membrane protein assembly factor BamE (lipoprotein component of BamABCDE complex)